MFALNDGSFVSAAIVVTILLSGSAHSTDLEPGKVVFVDRCMGCHEPPSTAGLSDVDLAKLTAGRSSNPNEATGRGPTMVSVVGRKAGAIKNYSYSEAMALSDVTWTEEALRDFLLNPGAFLPGTTMKFIGIKREGEMDKLLAYLKDAGDSEP